MDYASAITAYEKYLELAPNSAQRRADPGAHRRAEGDHGRRARPEDAAGRIGRQLGRRVERLGYGPATPDEGTHELRHQDGAGRDDVYVIALTGEVDLYTAPEFKQQLLEVIAQGAKQVSST